MMQVQAVISLALVIASVVVMILGLQTAAAMYLVLVAIWVLVWRW